MFVESYAAFSLDHPALLPKRTLSHPSYVHSVRYQSITHPITQRPPPPPPLPPKLFLPPPLPPMGTLRSDSVWIASRHPATASFPFCFAGGGKLRKLRLLGELHTEEGGETRVSFRKNQFPAVVHLVSFYRKRIVFQHGLLLA